MPLLVLVVSRLPPGLPAEVCWIKGACWRLTGAADCMMKPFTIRGRLCCSEQLKLFRAGVSFWAKPAAIEFWLVLPWRGCFFWFVC